MKELTIEKVEEIKKLLAENMTTWDIASIFKISVEYIETIKKGIIW